MAGPSTISKKQQEEIDKKRAAQEAQLGIDIQLLLQRPEFLRFFAYMLEYCDPMGPAFNLNGSVTNYTLGQQEVGKHLWSLLQKHKPEVLQQVLSAWNSLEEKQDA